MAKILLVVFADSGQLNPAIVVAQHLEGLGHEVAIASLQDDVSDRVTRAGVRARCFTCSPAASHAGKRGTVNSVKFASRLRQPAWVARWMTGVLVDPLPAQVPALQAVVDEWRPEVIATNAMAYAGAIVASRARIPWASLATGLQGFPPRDNVRTPYRDLADARAEATAAFGASLAFRESDVVSPHLNVSFALRELVPDSAPDDVHYVGPALPRGARGDEREFPFESIATDRPLVLVAFGSLVSHPPAVYQAITSALTADEATFVVVLKDLLGDPFVASLPPHVIVAEWVPQLQLLARSALMINHGGANSVLESLAHGVPVVVVPITQEQELVGTLVTDAGLGVSLPAAEITPERCREVFRRLLTRDAPERAAARALAGHRDGAARAAALVAQLS